MALETRFAGYIEAFNAGDTAAYLSYYAPDVVLVNGAGDKLHGREAIGRYYDLWQKRMPRRIEVLAVVTGRATFAAALFSRFEVMADTVEFAGRTLRAGDAVELRSMALYELEGDLFARIQGRTLERRFLSAGVEPL